MYTNASKLRVEKVTQHAFKSELFQAEIRQEITKTYPSRSVGNNMQSAFAPKSMYNLPENSYGQKRVCWVDVPKGWTKDDAQKQLDSLYANGANPCIYQVLSFEPILTDSDYGYMDTLSEDDRVEFLENKKEKQQVINPETGEIAEKNGKTIYRRLFFSDTARADVDNTGAVKRVSAIQSETAQEQTAQEQPAEKVAEPANAIDNDVEF